MSIPTSTEATPVAPESASSPEQTVQKAVKDATKAVVASTDPNKARRDDFIMDTNNSSIVSKRSVERLYYPGETEYFRHFVHKFKRRSPLINRGYWLRMKAIESTVTRFLSERNAKRKLVVNLGCGYDPLPFMFAGKHPTLIQGATFVDVDYPQLMRHKLDVIDKTEQIRQLLPNYVRLSNGVGLLATSDPYVAVGCDLNNMDETKAVLDVHLRMDDPSVAILFVGEVSLAYMSKDASQAVIRWAATHADVRFCLLEQHLPDGPDHPFAATMLTHFKKLNTPLNAIGTIDDMRSRFQDAGWPEAGIDIRTLWELWSDPTFLPAESRRNLDRIEPFDEWEEFALFGSHYFLLVAEKNADHDYVSRGRRASVGGSLRASLHSSPGSSVSSLRVFEMPAASSSMDQPLEAPELDGPSVSRRFAGLVPAISDESQSDAVGFLGGIGSQERRNDCDTYASNIEQMPLISGPPLRVGLSCFTLTKLGSTTDCLMAGGRTSPDKATADCWLRQNGVWKKSQDLSEGRFRHCAVALKLPTDQRPTHTVLLYGGKTSEGHVLDEWLLWTHGSWKRVDVVGEVPPARFGAAMITDVREGVSGVLVGGMTSAGRVLGDFWHWSVEADMKVHCRNITARALSVLQTNANILGRFGAQLVRSNSGILLIGGIGGNRMLTRQDEILNMKLLRPQRISGPRPMLVGCSIVDVDGGLLVLGGGATCFSFGTYWNRPSILTDDAAFSMKSGWRFRGTQGPNGSLQLPDTDNERTPRKHPDPVMLPASASLERDGTPSFTRTEIPGLRPISRTSLANGLEFENTLATGMPTIFSDGDIGPCVQTWTLEYLEHAIGADRDVVVHASTTERMDFQNKNFSYMTTKFGEFLSSVQRGERVYLRSLSRTAPSDQPTNLADDYPEIAADFELPGELLYVVENLHSSPLRISGPVNMWLHYDVMANVLCQVRGRKRLLLYPPSDVSFLGFAAGASSSSLDVFNPPADMAASLARAHPYEAFLEPGDILFIPPMWIHTAAPTDGTSVAVNIFFRSLHNQSYSAGRDVYGNRDLAAYERGRKDIARIVKSFESLPADVSGFYLERLGHELLNQARLSSRSAQTHAVNGER